jgi:BirA family biotin operon repressor/biotin-[acetyl-CoA-carboxylase] ligase
MDSTHRWTKKNSEALDPDALTCITADEQTQGIGQRGRKWISPPGCNIYVTLYFTLPQSSSFLSNLGQLLCLSTAAILERKGCAVEIKWPNDLLAEKKKLAGTLCEALTQENRLAVILSLGLNVNMSAEQLHTVDQKATSLSLVTGRIWDIEGLQDEIVKALLHNLSLLEAQGFAPFHKAYEELLAFKGEPIRCWDGHQNIEGICEGIQPDGRLMLRLPNGETRFLSSGEVNP